MAQWEATFGDGIDQLIEYRDFAASSPVVPLADHRNSPIATWNPTTEAIEQLARYDLHGRLTVLDANEMQLCAEQDNPGVVCDPPSTMPFAFNGRWRSPLTGLVNMRARWYSPRLGQFTAPDPLGYIDLYHLYGFAAFDPVNGWDPFGFASRSLGVCLGWLCTGDISRFFAESAENIETTAATDIQDVAAIVSRALAAFANPTEENLKQLAASGIIALAPGGMVFIKNAGGKTVVMKVSDELFEKLKKALGSSHSSDELLERVLKEGDEVADDALEQADEAGEFVIDTMKAGDPKPELSRRRRGSQETGKQAEDRLDSLNERDRKTRGTKEGTPKVIRDSDAKSQQALEHKLDRIKSLDDATDEFPE